MERKAVLIVCNNQGTKIDMRGSGDDVTGMYNCLIDVLGFSENDINFYPDTDQSAAAATAESECIKLKKELEKKDKYIERLKLETDDKVQVVKRQIEETSQKLADARRDADIAENERIKVKTKLEQREERVKSLKLECQQVRQSALRKVEKKQRELVDARKIAENELIKVKEELQGKLELMQLLQLKCDESRENAMRQVEKKESEIADILNATTNAALSSVVAQPCAICLVNEKNMAFGCGHMTCQDCGVNEDLSKCHICRKEITLRIKLFPG